MFVHMYNKEFLKGTIKTLLLSLLDEKGDMYGYEITQTIKSRSEEHIVLTEGALYPALHKLEHNNLVESFTQKAGGRTRKYYRLTVQGKKEAAKAKAGWSVFANVMNTVINPFSHA